MPRKNKKDKIFRLVFFLFTNSLINRLFRQVCLSSFIWCLRRLAFCYTAPAHTLGRRYNQAIPPGFYGYTRLLREAISRIPLSGYAG